MKRDMQRVVVRRFDFTLGSARAMREARAGRRTQRDMPVPRFVGVRQTMQHARHWIDEGRKHGEEAEQQPRKKTVGHIVSIVDRCISGSGRRVEQPQGSASDGTPYEGGAE